jgi:hypothetical protein
MNHITFAGVENAVAGAGVVAQLIALGVLHGDVEHIASVALAVLTALGVYQVKNTA